jgi:hypothetical protein
MMKNNKKSCLMLIINNNAITKFIYKDFIIGEYNKEYSYTQNKTIHLIISNKNKLLPEKKKTKT